MKSFFKVCIFIGLIFSCSPEKMLTKKLEGDWDLETIDGQTILPNSTTLKFTKDNNRSGNVFLFSNDNISTSSKAGIYSLFKSQTITIAFTTDSTFDTHVYTVTKYTKNELVLTEEGKGDHIFSYKKN